MLGYGKATGGFVPPEFDFALKVEPPPLDTKRAKQLMTEAAIPTASTRRPDAAPAVHVTRRDGRRLPPGHRHPLRVRNMERATFMTTWHEKKLKGLLIGATGRGGNAAARLEPFFTKGGIYAYGSLPEIDDLFQQQAKELDRKKREATAAIRSRRSSSTRRWSRRSSSKALSGA
jgi:peptide/nickel transport system substrate-binding protein